MYPDKLKTDQILDSTLTMLLNIGGRILAGGCKQTAKHIPTFFWKCF